jgi:hypothetical protein
LTDTTACVIVLGVTQQIVWGVFINSRIGTDSFRVATGIWEALSTTFTSQLLPDWVPGSIIFL